MYDKLAELLHRYGLFKTIKMIDISLLEMIRTLTTMNMKTSTAIKVLTVPITVPNESENNGT